MKISHSFLSILFGLGVVLVALQLGTSSSFAGSPVPEKISSSCDREVRVYLKTQRFGYYEKGKLKFSGIVCTGMKGHETPKGRFRVLNKYKKYFSKKYDGAPMPFAVQFSTCGCFLHVGFIAKGPASHGCIRLSNSDAERIFNSVKIHDPITIE